MIRIRVFSNDATILPELVDLIKKDSLIPVFGSGYTRGCSAHDGKVPSGDDMKDHMKKSVSAISGSCDHAYDNYDFKKICRLYNKRVPRENQIKYFMDNFTEVQLPLSRRRFINIFKGHMYTLNIDDAIEQSSSRQVILPRSEFLENYLDNFKVVFKIHGDVHDIIKYAPGSSCGLVFDTKQYIKSLNDNKCMLSKFKVDFVDSNMAYICCSLEDEWDLLSVIQNDVRQSITLKTTYYISINKPDDDTIDILEDYGITDYIHIDNIDFFCKTIADATEARPSEFEGLVIDSYKEKPIKTLSKSESNLNFLLSSDNLVKLPFDDFCKPAFFITRDIVSHIVKSLGNPSPIHLIHGHRISGKTYCAFSVYEYFKNKDRYFFPTGIKIDSAMMKEVFSRRSALFVFDSGTLSTKQLILITDQRKTLTNNNSYIVIVSNTSDHMGINQYSSPFTPDEVSEVKNVFSWSEEAHINSILQNINLPTFLFHAKKRKTGLAKYYFRNYTLLDNLYKIAIEFSGQEKSLHLPQISCVTSPMDFSLMIIFATFQNVDLSRIYYYDLMEECSEFISKYPMLANIVAISHVHGARNSSKVVNINARYFLLKELGKYANDISCKKLISDAYLYLYGKIEDSELDFISKCRSMLDFIKYDVINDVFIDKSDSVTQLIKYIYATLEPQLNKSFQFKHQRAKSILWLCQDSYSDILDAVKYIDLAEYDMRNVMSTRPASISLQIAYEHVCYTQAILYGRLCVLEKFLYQDHIKKSIDYYGRSFLSPQRDKELAFVKSGSMDNIIISDLNTVINFCLSDKNHDTSLMEHAQDLDSAIGKRGI